MDPNVKLLPNQGEPYTGISFLFSVVSQFLNSPCDNRQEAITRILKYTKGSPGKGLVFCDRGNTNIIGYSDVDWARDASDKRFTLSYCVFIRGNLISRKIVQSSTEVEYPVMAMPYVSSCD